MKVAILRGGKGSRIREVTEVIPKPMIPVGDRPILWHIMKIYSSYGHYDFVLLLGHKGRVIRDYFLNYAAYTMDVTVNLSSTGPDRLFFHGKSPEPWRITLVDTGEETMTGARLWRARHHFKQEDMICVTYRDGVGNIDSEALVHYHRSHGRLGTLTGVRPAGRFAEFKVKGPRIYEFNEKPQVSGSYINGGFFVLGTEVFERFFNDREDLMLEREPLQQMSRNALIVLGGKQMSNCSELKLTGKPL